MPHSDSLEYAPECQQVLSAVDKEKSQEPWLTPALTILD